MPSIEPYELKDAQQLVNAALRQARGRHSEWRLLEQLYAAGTTDGLVANASSPGDMSRVIEDVTGVPLDVVNMVLPHINIVVSSVVSRSPRLLCEPLSGGQESEDYAVIAEAALKYFWNRSRATSDLYDATKDAVVNGNGFLKVSWSYVEREKAKPADDVAFEQQSALSGNLFESVLNGQELLDPATVENAVALTTVEVEEDEPYVEYVSPYDVFVPVDARRMWESRWVAQRVIKPVDELRAQLGLSADVELSTLNGMERDNPQSVRDPQNRDVFQYAEVFEFYDMRTRTMLVFQRGGSTVLFEGPLPYEHRFPPFVHIANYRKNPSEFWAFGDLKNIAGLQAMLNETFQEQMENMRRSGNKVFISERLATPEVEEALRSSENNLAIKVPLQDGVPIQQEIMPMAAQPLPSDVYQVSAQLQQGMAEVLGLSEFQRGLSGADRMSGTAAAAVEGNTSLRAADKVAAVEAAASEVGTLMLLLAQEFMSRDTAIRIAGSRGVVWANVSPELIRGEFKVSVEGGSMQAVNPATRAQRALDRANIVLPILVNNGYDPEPLLRSLLRDLGEDPDVVLKKTPEAPAGQPAPDAGGMPAGPAAGGLSAADVAALPLESMLPFDVPVEGPQVDVGGDAIANQLGGGLAL